MARMQWLAVATLGLTLVGCVSQDKYTALKMDRDRLAEQLGQADADARAARAEANALKAQMGSIMGSGQNRDAMISNLSQQIADRDAQLADLMRRYEEAMKRPVGSVALPQDLTNELSAFAAANPDLVDFDAARGIVKFKSDVTFATGSAELTPKAQEAISRFASILNSAAASQYELMVAGHTDSTRVVNPATIQAGHKDNWYLSSHRAISVGQTLMKQGINPQRLGVVGYADQRPIASNGSEAGRAQNRRVEVLILPNQVRSGAPRVVNTTAAPAARSNLNKDTVNNDTRPMINK